MQDRFKAAQKICVKSTNFTGWVDGHFQFPAMKASGRDPRQYLRQLIDSGESQQLDFKFEISDARKIARTFSAFANTLGGRLLIGVKDNGRISGIRSDEEAYMAESAAQLYCKPAVPFTLKKWEVEGRSVLEIEVPASSQRPHYARNEDDSWKAYVRVADQNLQANRILVTVWKMQGRKAVRMTYGREEKTLLEYLSANESITLSRFVKIARTSRIQAEKVLVNLILLKVVEWETTEQSMIFRMKRDAALAQGYDKITGQ